MIIWGIFGGLHIALKYFIAGLILMIIRASLTSAIVILAQILSIGMYFAYLLVRAEANKPRQSEQIS